MVELGDDIDGALADADQRRLLVELLDDDGHELLVDDVQILREQLRQHLAQSAGQQKEKSRRLVDGDGSDHVGVARDRLAERLRENLRVLVAALAEVVADAARAGQLVAEVPNIQPEPAQPQQFVLVVQVVIDGDLDHPQDFVLRVVLHQQRPADAQIGDVKLLVSDQRDENGGSDGQLPVDGVQAVQHVLVLLRDLKLRQVQDLELQLLLRGQQVVDGRVVAFLGRDERRLEELFDVFVGLSRCDSTAEENVGSCAAQSEVRD